MKCRNCGNEQLEEPPQGLKIPPKVLYLDIETALMKITSFKVGQQYVSWKNVEQDTFVICWGAAWMGQKKLDVISRCVTSAQAKRHDDTKILAPLWELMNDADYIVGHNMRAFDWKILNNSFITLGWEAPHDAKIMDTLLLSRRRFRSVSHSMDAWIKKLGGKQKEDMRREDWEKVLSGDQKSLDKMHKYCRSDIRRGVKITEAFQRYCESASGDLLFK